MKTGTTQKQNLSVAVSQGEWAPERQEQAQKEGGSEQRKRASLVPAMFTSTFAEGSRGLRGQHVGQGPLRLL